MDKVYDPIYAYELIDRWSCSEGFLNKLHSDRDLTPYRCLEIRVDPNSMDNVAFSERIYGTVFALDVGESVQDVVYPRAEVTTYETYHPEILWKTAKHGPDLAINHGRKDVNKTKFIDPSTSTELSFAAPQQSEDQEDVELPTKKHNNSHIVTPFVSEWVPAEDARIQLQMTPAEFIRMLDSGTLETEHELTRLKEYNEWIYYNNDPEQFRFFKYPFIKDGHIHALSLKKYLEEERDNATRHCTTKESFPANEWIPANEVRKIFTLSPIQFISMLNAGAVETNDEQGRRDFAERFGYQLEDVPYFKTQDIERLYVFRSSFESYIERNPMKHTPYAVTDDTITLYIKYNEEIKQRNSEGKNPIIELEAELAQARQEIKRLTQEVKRLQADGNWGGASIPKTAPAVAARSEKTAEKWAAHLLQAVSLAVECARKNEACSYSDHQKKWENRFGSSPVRAALRAMRGGLPDDLVEGPR